MRKHIKANRNKRSLAAFLSVVLTGSVILSSSAVTTAAAIDETLPDSMDEFEETMATASWADSIPELLSAGPYEEGVVIVGIDLSGTGDSEDPGDVLETQTLKDNAEELITVDAGNVGVVSAEDLFASEFAAEFRQLKDGLFEENGENGESGEVCITAITRPDMSTAQLLSLLSREKSVLFAEPNYLADADPDWESDGEPEETTFDMQPYMGEAETEEMLSEAVGMEEILLAGLEGKDETTTEADMSVEGDMPVDEDTPMEEDAPGEEEISIEEELPLEEVLSTEEDILVAAEKPLDPEMSAEEVSSEAASLEEVSMEPLFSEAEASMGERPAVEDRSGVTENTSMEADAFADWSEELFASDELSDLDEDFSSDGLSSSEEELALYGIETSDELSGGETSAPAQTSDGQDVFPENPEDADGLQDLIEDTGIMTSDALADSEGNGSEGGNALQLTAGSPDGRPIQWSMNEKASPHAAGITENVSMRVPGYPYGSTESNMDHEIIVAVLDVPVDFNNPDLSEKAYTFSDTLMQKLGCNAHGYNALWDAKTTDFEYFPGSWGGNHGTHVAGIIGAAWNDNGVSGVASNVKIISVQNSAPGGTTSLIDTLRGMNFIKEAKENGVDIRVVNNSWGVYQTSRALDAAVTELGRHGIISIFAAGNEGKDLNSGTNLASTLSDNPYAIIVASTTQAGRLAASSCYGSGIVTLAAPGDAILSCIQNDEPKYLPMMAAQNKVYENFESAANIGDPGNQGNQGNEGNQSNPGTPQT